MGIVAIILPVGFLMVHLPFPNIAVHLALSRRLTDIKVSAKSGAYTTSLSNARVRCDPFGKSMRTSPIPMALKVRPSADLMVQMLIL